MKQIVLSLLIVATVIGCTGSKKDLSKVNNKEAIVGFYNLENLFDTIKSEGIFDEEFTPEGRKAWNNDRYVLKKEMLSSVIKGIGDTSGVKGPAVMGLCEVENKDVIVDLIAQPALKDFNYKIVHQDSPDKRGIDVALIYMADVFVLEHYKAVPLFIYDEKDGDRIYTRDQLVVTGQLLGEKTHFIVNHWPSRYGGEERSRPHRKSAAELSRVIVDSLHALDNTANIILMGDLNDDPHNVSVKETLRAVGKHDLNGNDLYNPLADQHTDSVGTLCYRGTWNMFDQMVISTNLLDKDNGLRFKSAHIYTDSNMKVSEGDYAGYPFRTYVGNRYDAGYSDHFPVFIRVQKK